MTNAFDQHGYRVRTEWGPEGVRELAPVSSVVVIVDVLSFSTAVDIAVGRGGSVRPLVWGTTEVPDGVVLAGRHGTSPWSLSPSSLLDLPAGTRLGLASPNGATLSAAAAGHDAAVLAGCLRNASAVAAAAAELAGEGAVTVIAAGERWPADGKAHRGTLRPAVEDLIGAGAVVAALLDAGRRAGAAADADADADAGTDDAASPEALAAADAFRAAERRGLAVVLAGCSSGRELIADGKAANVELAAALDASVAVPLLRDGEYWAAHG